MIELLLAVSLAHADERGAGECTKRTTGAVVQAPTATAETATKAEVPGKIYSSHVRDLLIEARDRYPGPERYPEANQHAFEAKAQEAFAELRCLDEVIDTKTAVLARLVRALYDEGTVTPDLCDTLAWDGLTKGDFPPEICKEVKKPASGPPTRRIAPPLWGRFSVNGKDANYDPAHSFVVQRLDGDTILSTELVLAQKRPAPYVQLRPVLGSVVGGTALLAGAALAGAWALDQQVNSTAWNHAYHSADEVRAVQASNHALVVTAIAAGAVSVNAGIGLALTFR